MRQQHIVLLGLSFLAGLFVGHYYPQEYSGENVSSKPSRQFQKPVTAGAHRSTSVQMPGSIGPSASIERLRGEYADVLWQLGLPELDVQKSVENFAPSRSFVDEHASTPEPISPLDPSPQDLAIDLKMALLDLGIAPEEAQVAADNLIEQMEQTPVLPDDESGVSPAISTDGVEGPLHDAE